MQEDPNPRSSEKYQKLTWSKNTYVCPRSNTPSHYISIWARFLDIFKPLLLLTSFFFHCTLLKIVKLWFGKKYFEIYKLLFNLTTNKLKEYQAGKQASYCNCVFEIVFLLYLKSKKYVVKGKYRQIRKDMLFIYKDLSKLKISLLYSSFYYLCTVQWNPPYNDP